MNDSETKKTDIPQPKRWKILRRCLVGAGICLTLICFYYTEELWRGKAAWENCKRELNSKGIKADWTEPVPTPVPDEQNVFAAPEMQKWLREKAHVPEDSTSSNLPSRSLVIADVTIGLPGANPPGGSAVLSFADPQARMEAERMIQDAVGPSFIDAYGFPHILRQPEEIQAVKILLQCQNAPTVSELEQFFASPVVPGWAVLSSEDGEEKVRIEPAGNGLYRVEGQPPSTAAEFLAEIAPWESEFATIQKILQRPYAQVLAGDLEDGEGESGWTARRFLTAARNLVSMAQCHLLQGQPEKALRELTITYDLGRIPSTQPVTGYSLLTLLVHVSVTSIEMGAVAEGLARHAWGEPQLVALQEQLQEINFLPEWRQIILTMPAMDSHYFENATPYRLGEGIVGFRFGYPIETNSRAKLAFALTGNLIPRGWVYQNMVQRAKLLESLAESVDLSGQMVFPGKVEAVTNAATFHPSPYSFLAIEPLHYLTKNIFAIAKAQTTVHEALIVCGLERYRLARGEYPETLDALVPQFLDKVPHDVIGGQPPHYRREADGKFLLYSVGWSGEDGGGVPGKSTADGDWVWPNL